jgi:hypothetical protein
MTDAVRIGLLSAYRKIMEPLVRILIRNGVSFSELIEILRSVFVEVAERDFAIPGRKTSQSRIAILTGLTRKEVAKQKNILESGAPNVVTNLNRITRVLVGWHTDPEFTGPYGLPLDLPFDEPGGASFVELCRRHSGDMAPRAMLDELLRVRAVEKLSTGTFKVLMRAYLPQTMNPDYLERFGEVVGSYIGTHEYNLQRQASARGRFERIVFADDGLREELIPAFEALIQMKAQNLLIEIDNWLSSQELSPGAAPKSRKRVKTGLGIYHFLED